ncbi:MAG: FG-GAP-like repeat-containing protein [Myxococcota bacterium]
MAVVAVASVHAQPFEDVSGAYGLPTQVFPAGGDSLIAAASFADLDGDGDLDMVRSGGSAPPRLYRRTSALGVFAPDDVAFAGAAQGLTNTRGHLLFDMDGDGDRDVLFVRDGVSVLFENRGGAFVDVTQSHFPSIVGWANSAAAGDLDGDGDLDLVVARYIDRVEFPMHHCLDNLVLENDGAGRFVDRSHDAGFDQVRGCSFMSALADIDGDLDLDVVVINDFARFRGGQELWINDGDFHFHETAAAVGFVAPVYGMGVALGDADQDGRWDAVVTDIGEPVAFERQPDGAFVDAMAARRLALRFAADLHQVTWTAAWEDFDADGYLDLVMASGQLPAAAFIGNSSIQRSVLLRGSASGALVEVPADGGFADLDHSARDVHFEDIDQDGRLEIVLAHVNSRVAVYRNTHSTPVGTLTTLELVPSATGAGAAGAQVRATACGIQRSRWVVGGAAYGSADRGIVRLAWPMPCGGDGQAVSAVIRWPSGFEQSVDTTTGATLRVVEPSWLHVEPDAITVDFANRRTNVTNVKFAATGLVVEPAIEVAPGRWRSAFSWDGDAERARFDITVDGQLWGAHPRVSRAVGPPVFFDPPSVPVGHTFVVSTAPDADIAWDGHVVSADANGRAILTAPSSLGDAPLEVTADGATTVRSVPVVARAERSRSELIARDLHILSTMVSTTTVRLRARLLDANGAPADMLPSSFSLAVDGVEQAADDTTRENDWWTLRIAQSKLKDGTDLQVLIDGEPWFESQEVAQLTNPTDVAALVDPERSGCWLSEPRLWAGGDRGTVLGLLYDTHGTRLPDFGIQPVWTSFGVTLPSDGGQQLGTLAYTASVAPGATSGSVQLGFANQPELVSCTIPVGPRPAFDPATRATLVTLSQAAPTLGVAAPWRVIPLSVSGRGIGGGVDVELAVDGGDVVSGPSYTGLGHYDASIVPTALTMTVRALEGTREIARVQVAVVDPGAVEPGPEPTPEESPEAVDDVAVESDTAPADDTTDDAMSDDAGVDATAEDGTSDDAVGGDPDATSGADAVDGGDSADAPDSAPAVEGDGAASDASDAAVEPADGGDAGDVGPGSDAEGDADAGAVERAETRRASDDGCGGGGPGRGLAVALLALAYLARRSMRRCR